MSAAVAIERSNACLIVRFTRPEIRNPLSLAVLDELDSIFEGLDAAVTALIFVGTDDIFASGANLREIAKVEDARAFARRGQELMTRIAKSQQLTISAINGFCFGGALDLALACKKRIASANAQFAHPGAGLGIITGWGGTQRLPRLVGTANALEMFFTASPLDAKRAFDLNLLDEIADDPLASALELASKQI